MYKLKLYFLLYSTPTVVIQSYETDVAKEYVILGNDALMKCSIPSFVADSVSVMGWTNSEDELKLFTQENFSQMNFKNINTEQCKILSCVYCAIVSF